MNKFINAVLAFILMPTMLLVVFIGFDLPLTIFKTSGANLPYRHEILLGIGLLILVINIRRSVRRWMGMIIVSRKDKFKWNAPVSSSRARRVLTYLLLEAVVMAFVGVALYKVSSEAWMPAIGYLFGAFDSVLFGLIGGRTRYRIGLSSKALIVADREVTILYFNGLRKVSIQQQSIYFDYVKGLQLSFPSDCVEEENRAEFFTMLEEQLDPDKVYFSKNM
ncbi:MAG: hypothetical protein QNK23_08150 [Crocinitomicaceae bacterium]|nr:hypothetical protein [Crocinitomicaceae bacterium]